jgi:hypothetical protein
MYGVGVGRGTGVAIGVGTGVAIGVGTGVAIGVGTGVAAGASMRVRVAHRRVEPIAALIDPARIAARARLVFVRDMVRPRVTVPAELDVTVGNLRIRDPRLVQDPA